MVTTRSKKVRPVPPVRVQPVRAVRAQQNKVAVPPSMAVREAKNETSRGGRRGGGRRGKSGKTCEVAQPSVTNDVNLGEKNLHHDKLNGVDEHNGKEYEVSQFDEVAQDDDKPAGEEGKSDFPQMKMTLDEATNGTRNPPQLLGMFFEFLCALFKSPFRVARSLYAGLQSVFTNPASGASKASTTLDSTEIKKILQDLSHASADRPSIVDWDSMGYNKCTSTTLHPIKIHEMLQDISHVIPDPPLIVDSDSLHDKGNRIAEFNDLCLRVKELSRQERDIKRNIKEFINLFKACSTVDECQICCKWGLKVVQELEAFEEEGLIATKRLQKLLYFELCYCNL